ncbi:hypothetical protein QZH41_010807, partial [Actinostola sp. cb2023]
CHTEPSLDDLGLAFTQTGVLLHELEDFVSQVDQVPFSYQLPQFPMPKPNLLQHPHKEDIVDRPEFYHEHLPPLIKALQQNEDEREGNKDESQGIEDPASQSFLRNEIRTVGKETENESIENTPEKRALAISSPDLETDAKRRRMEGPFGKHSKENKLDILQVLQEKNNSNSLSPSSSPDFVPMDTEHSDKPIFTFSRTSTPSPAIPPTVQLAPKKVVVKTDKPSKKKLLSPPKSQKSSDQKQSKPQLSPATEKESDKPKSKSVTGSTSKAKKNTPAKSTNTTPAEKPLQQTFSKPKTPKKSKPKVSSQENKPKPKAANKAIVPPLTITPVASNKSHIEDASLQAHPMPKLIIKPMKLEKNLNSEYSVSSVPLDESRGLEKKIIKKKLIAPSTLSKTDEAKPKKKKKKKDIDINVLGSPPPEKALPLHVPSSDAVVPASISTHLFIKAPIVEKVGEIIKKKKKKHKEKDRDKSKPKKIKEAAKESSLPIPTIKLKLENAPSTTISSYIVPAIKIEPTIIVKTKDELSEMQRTVITETLSTTVCTLADDGSFMIGCDTCDSWYHGACVGIINDPGGDWYCEVCLAKKTKKKKKKKKTKAN